MTQDKSAHERIDLRWFQGGTPLSRVQANNLLAALQEAYDEIDNRIEHQRYVNKCLIDCGANRNALAEALRGLLAVTRYGEWTHDGNKYDSFISSTFDHAEWLKYREAHEIARAALARVAPKPDAGQPAP